MPASVPSASGAQPDDLLSAEEAAPIRGCTPRHLRRLAKAGVVPARVLGNGSYVFVRSDVENEPEPAA